MNDNLLNLVDVRRLPGEEPLTVEGALFGNLPPLRELSIADLNRLKKHTVLLRLAKQYLVDFDLVRACARADLAWELYRGAERDPLFISIVRGLMDEMPPDEVVTRAELLLMLKREATTSSKASDRIAAINSLARLAGMELADTSKEKSSPTINITLNTGPVPGEKPMINVTASVKPEALL